MGAKTLLHMATQQPDRIDAMVLVSATPYFPAQARAAMAQLSVDAFSDADWAAQRQRHVHGDDQIRMLFDQMRGLKDSYDDMAFTPPLLGDDHRAHADRARRSRSALSGRARAGDVSRDPGSALWVVPERRPRTDLRRDGRAVRPDGDGFLPGPATDTRNPARRPTAPSPSLVLPVPRLSLRHPLDRLRQPPRARVSVFASVIHSRYSRLWLGLKPSKPPGPSCSS